MLVFVYIITRFHNMFALYTAVSRMAPGDSKGGPCCFVGSVICKLFIVVFYDYKEENKTSWYGTRKKIVLSYTYI